MPRPRDYYALTKPTASGSGPSASSSAPIHRASAHSRSTLVASEVIDISEDEVVKPSNSNILNYSDNDVIDILSESEEPPRKRFRSNCDTISRLREELREAKKEKRKAEGRLEAMRKNAEKRFEWARSERKKAEEILEEAKREKMNTAEKVGDMQGISIDVLRGIVRCTICDHTAWRPYMLPACGHVFCQTCIRDWFVTTVNNYRATHANWTADTPAPENLGLVVADEARPDPYDILPLLVRLADINNLDSAFLAGYHRLWRLVKRGVGFASTVRTAPNFTCPSCRTVVKTRPVECFMLKDLTTAIGEVTGEAEPDTVSGKGKQKVSPAWDEFFGKER